jgi:hypothetical protein
MSELDTRGLEQLLRNTDALLFVLRSTAPDFLREQIDKMLDETRRRVADLKEFNRKAAL